jgi:glycine hydroxymethyltransferase
VDLNKPLQQADPKIFEAIQQETRRQSEKLELIASENFVSRAVLEATGSAMTNKYAEGYSGRRYYGGCEHVDVAEDLAVERAKKLFGAEYINVQPHAGSQANMAVYHAVCKPGDTVLAMSIDHGGHLTHGHKVNFSGKLYNPVGYGVSKSDYRIDMNEVEDLAKKHKPRLIIAGTTAYSRQLDYAAFRQIADSVDAVLQADMAHPAGLVAKGEHPDPVPHCDFVSSTTHKTLRGPRSGIVMCREQFAKKLKSAVFPGLQGGPLMHVIAAKAVAFGEALTDDFGVYIKQVVKNAKVLADELQQKNVEILTGGTDTHCILVDLRSRNVTGADIENRLDEANITVNKNLIPFDERSAMVTSGLRIGPAALTTRGMKEDEMKAIGGMIARIIDAPTDDTVIKSVRAEVDELCQKFLIYQDLLV